MQTVELYKPEGQSLGFKVVGLNKTNNQVQGIYIQEIHDNGIAARYVRLISLEWAPACAPDCVVIYYRGISSPPTSYRVVNRACVSVLHNNLSKSQIPMHS